MRLLNHPGSILVLALSAILIAPLSTTASPHEGKGKGNPNKEQKQGKGHKQSHSQGPQSGHKHKQGASLPSVTIGFDGVRRFAVSNRYTGYRALPPGVRKNLARGKPLPPGIAMKTVPGPLLAELPRYPGYEWHVAGRDLVLVGITSAVIAEVLFDIFE